jgi:hypothetical protein
MLPSGQPAPSPAPGAPRRNGAGFWSRETRLLLVTIVIAVGVLVGLARYRFPPEQARTESVSAPLERLATRATFDELAATVERLDRRIGPSLVVLRVLSAADPEPRTLRQILERRPAMPNALAYVPAVRVRPDLVLAMIGRHDTVHGVVGDAAAAPDVVATDRIRGLALVRVPPPAFPGASLWAPVDVVTAPRYAVAVEGSSGGRVLRPVFLGRAGPVDAARWDAPLLALSSAPMAAEGALLFALEGPFIGLVATESGGFTIVPAEVLQRIADRLLEHGSPAFTDFGLALQALPGTTAASYGITGGVVVVAVTAGSLAAGRVVAGDLIRSVDGLPAVDPEAVLLRLAQAAPESTILLQVRRGDTDLDVTLVVPPASGRDDRSAGESLDPYRR